MPKRETILSPSGTLVFNVCPHFNPNIHRALKSWRHFKSVLLFCKTLFFEPVWLQTVFLIPTPVLSHSTYQHLKFPQWFQQHLHLSLFVSCNIWRQEKDILHIKTLLNCKATKLHFYNSYIWGFQLKTTRNTLDIVSNVVLHIFNPRWQHKNTFFLNVNYISIFSHRLIL